MGRGESRNPSWCILPRSVAFAANERECEWARARDEERIRTNRQIQGLKGKENGYLRVHSQPFTLKWKRRLAALRLTGGAIGATASRGKAVWPYPELTLPK